MILEITEFDHPALRTKGRPVAKVDDELRTLIADMIDTMRAAEGIGLAAQQVGRPLRLFVLEVPQMKNRPSALRIDGRPSTLEEHMPMVLINPEIETFGPVEPEGEGCLSFPGLLGDVARPRSTRVRAMTPDGSTITFEADGLLARAVQHEFDHIEGILFIDRFTPEDLKTLPEDIRPLARPRPSAR